MKPFKNGGLLQTKLPIFNIQESCAYAHFKQLVKRADSGIIAQVS